MKFLLGLLGAKPWLWGLAALALVGSLGGIYAYIDHQGYKRASTEWALKYERRETELQKALIVEADRQAVANDSAKRREAERLAQAQAEIDALNAAIIEMDRAAEADPNRDRIGLGVDSVKRLNRIR
jgi:hypothetical protein